MSRRLYSAGNYDTPNIGAEGRGRTIAAFHIAQDRDVLAGAPMRRDVLTFLTSPRAVDYWLNQKRWLEHCGRQGRVALLRLTAAGLRECANSLTGRAATNTTPALVDAWRRRMVTGDSIATLARDFELAGS